MYALSMAVKLPPKKAISVDFGSFIYSSPFSTVAVTSAAEGRLCFPVMAF